MCKHRIYKKILHIVSAESGINIDKIISLSKHLDVVDARSIIIYCLYSKGFHISEIASIFKKTNRSIRYTISKFDNRISQNKMMKIIYEKLNNLI